MVCRTLIASMKTSYFHDFFRSLLLFHSCSEVLWINKKVFLKNITFWPTWYFWLKLCCFLCASLKLQCFYYTAISSFNSHSTLTASTLQLTVCCRYKMGCVECAIWSRQLWLCTEFLSIQHSILVYTALNSSLFNTQFLSKKHSVSLYTTLNSFLYNTQFLSIQHSISFYTTLNSSQ